MKDTFLFYADLLEPISAMSDADAGMLFKGILAYANGIEPELSDAAAMAFSFIRIRMDKAERDYEAFCEKQRQNGMLGGRPRKQTVFCETQENPNNPTVFCETQENPNNPKNKNKDKNKDKDKCIDIYTPRFKKPTLEEVRAYCTERGNRVDPEAFIDHYEANGWKVGKNPVKDWKACVRTWEKTGYNRPQQQTHTVDRLRSMMERGAFDE